MGLTVDLPRLAGVLEVRITADSLSWRKAAGQIGVSPALLSRLRNGQQPDLAGYAKIVRWLDMSADEFLRSPAPSTRGGSEQKELSSEVSALLRARADLSDSDKKYLEEIFRATLTHVRSSKRDDS
jgi:transcriptional regulator with XRE-family HTH domain